MDNRNLRTKLLSVLIQRNRPITLSVTGTSMNPTLWEGDTVTIEKREDYDTGDILVFRYKDDSLLIHRLVKKKKEYFFCKGDNSFRLEDISINQIYGKVVAVNDKQIEPWPQWKIDLSYQVNREFLQCRYDKEETCNTEIYREYEKSILKQPEEEIYNAIQKK